MRRHHLITLLLAGAAAVTLNASPAYADATLYGGVSAGWLHQAESDNTGRTGAFVAGGAPVADGTSYGWNTKFDDGYTLSAETGFFYGSGLRSGIEIVYSKADVDRHTNAILGGAPLGALDASVLTGDAAPLGVTVAQALSRDDGDITNTALFANAYYDFNREGRIRPYLGAGVGVSKVDVKYAPSGFGVVDDDDTKFAWQGKAGVSVAVNEALQVYGEYAYRATDDIAVRNRLFPGTLDVENEQHAVSVGVRYKTGVIL